MLLMLERLHRKVKELYMLTQKKRVGNVTTPTIGYPLQRDLADETQAHASDARAGL